VILVKDQTSQAGEVSIPPWFDFAYIEIAQHVVELPGFNPTLVRFCRILVKDQTSQAEKFQSHLGSILPTSEIALCTL
jgi:hypothetical protein